MIRRHPLVVLSQRSNSQALQDCFQFCQAMGCYITSTHALSPMQGFMGFHITSTHALRPMQGSMGFYSTGTH